VREGGGEGKRERERERKRKRKRGKEREGERKRIHRTICETVGPGSIEAESILPPPLPLPLPPPPPCSRAARKSLKRMLHALLMQYACGEGEIGGGGRGRREGGGGGLRFRF